MQRSISWNSVPSIAERPLSTSTTWYSSGPSRSPGRRAAGAERGVDREILAGGGARQQRAAGWSRPPASARIFSMLASAMCTRGSVCVRSPLPSLVTITLLPVSAIRKLAPVMPTSAARNFARSRRARLGQDVAPLGEHAVGRQVGVRQAELRLPILAVEVEGGGDDVARRLVAELDDVFAEVGLDRRDAVARRGAR